MQILTHRSGVGLKVCISQAMCHQSIGHTLGSKGTEYLSQFSSISASNLLFDL